MILIYVLSKREYGLEKGHLELEQERARAAAERIAKGRFFIRNLINQTDFSDQQIASMAETTVGVPWVVAVWW
ncbi:hypothetical protein ORI89_04005 [Sphingobacterium sp. UT-1RO-CII-1]|uniref:hypothetical protein n=1 Tax=Sphingobacterium sp. UT-1RO-CII-1 TaxID=2995225 RepID=UPI00227A0CD9|nr:hypothetical protein [Sphingobacterium sp. UT-1RO-CII-1]MCY4778803.1 hypothetical protein [Sphingobacterium sp. UT-1RO-CII-1]